MQGVHAADLGTEYLPIGQDKQTLTSGGLYCPAPHTICTWMACGQSVILGLVPAQIHSDMQRTVTPAVALQEIPVGQEEPAHAAPKVPSSHPWSHDAQPSRDAVPDGEYCESAGHGRQMSAPGWSLYWPGGHGTHAVPSPEYVPTAHSSWTLWGRTARLRVAKTIQSSWFPSTTQCRE
jgi:hypothetical protein